MIERGKNIPIILLPVAKLLQERETLKWEAAREAQDKDIAAAIEIEGWADGRALHLRRRSKLATIQLARTAVNVRRSGERKRMFHRQWLYSDAGLWNRSSACRDPMMSHSEMP